MILTKFWRVELSEEGGVFSATECESKGTNGRRVIYVEANTQAEACSAAKAWHDRHKAKARIANIKSQAKVLASGICLSCRSRPTRQDRVTCQVCNDNRTARKREERAGVRVPRKHLDPEGAKLHILANSRLWRRRHGIFGMGSSTIIARLKEMGGEAFLAWLIAEQERRAKAWAAANPEPKAQAAE